MITNPGVCSWSLRPSNALHLVEQLRQVGLTRVQIALDPLREHPSAWAALPELCARHGVTFISGMFSTVGEDYSTLESIQRTGGVTPDATWDENWRNCQAVVPIAKKLGLKLITFHAGFMPHDSGDPIFKKLLQRITLMADLLAAQGMELGFETGQESAATLLNFLRQLDRPNVGVNFDPANIILYDQGDPIVALRVLAPWLRQCHIKDAVKTKIPGTWGEEVVVGSGEVDWRAFFQTTAQIGFRGNFVIEREAGEQRIADILAARKYLESLPGMKTVNVGVVGMGFMGATHIKAYLKIPGARVAAICRRLPGGDLSAIGGNLGDGQPLKLDLSQVQTYTSFDELIANPEIDLVDLCVPTPQHHSLAITALRAGKHVICEKPMARTPALGREMVEAATRAKGFFMPAMVMRFWPEWAWLKNAIADKMYGKVLAARFRRVASPPSWGRASYFNGVDSGGALLDLHIHDTDFVQFCFGRPCSVFSTGTTHFSGAIDHVVTAYQFASGIPVIAEGSWLMAESFGFKMEFTVNFERATADYDSTRGADALQLYEGKQKVRTICCANEDGYLVELRHMIESIQTGTPPSVTAADGLSAVEICAAEERSIQTGAPVSL